MTVSSLLSDILFNQSAILIKILKNKNKSDFLNTLSKLPCNKKKSLFILRKYVFQ